jgi:hypothetical protein
MLRAEVAGKSQGTEGRNETGTTAVRNPREESAFSQTQGVRPQSCLERSVFHKSGAWQRAGLGLEPTMKDPYQVLEQKKMEIERLRSEIEAIHFVIPLLTEEADWIENGLALRVQRSSFG